MPTNVSLDAESLICPLITARMATTMFLDAIPEDKWMTQPYYGANHPIWTAGHIATSDDYFLKGLFGRESALESWFEDFGPGSTPRTDRSSYPPMKELRDAMHERHEALLGAFRALTDDDWKNALPEDWQSFAPTYCELPGVIAWHEGMHAGQLTFIRRSYGAERVMM